MNSQREFLQKSYSNLQPLVKKTKCYHTTNKTHVIDRRILEWTDPNSCSKSPHFAEFTEFPFHLGKIPRDKIFEVDFTSFGTLQFPFSLYILICKLSPLWGLDYKENLLQRICQDLYIFSLTRFFFLTEKFLLQKNIIFLTTFSLKSKFLKFVLFPQFFQVKTVW